jgi:hypothetical protein
MFPTARLTVQAAMRPTIVFNIRMAQKITVQPRTLQNLFFH